MLSVGLLRARRFFGVFAPALSAHPGSRMVAVSDIDIVAAQRLAAQYGAEKRDTGPILNDPAIHAGLVATSADPRYAPIGSDGSGQGRAVRKAGRPVSRPGAGRS